MKTVQFFLFAVLAISSLPTLSFAGDSYRCVATIYTYAGNMQTINPTTGIDESQSFNNTFVSHPVVVTVSDDIFHPTTLPVQTDVSYPSKVTNVRVTLATFKKTGGDSYLNLNFNAQSKVTKGLELIGNVKTSLGVDSINADAGLVMPHSNQLGNVIHLGVQCDKI